MAKFKFPLQKVLEHRQIKENLAQKDFQDALGELTILQERLSELEAQSDDARVKAFTLQNEGGMAGAGLVQADQFLNLQKILIKKQQEKIQHQEKIVEEKRDLLRLAAVDKKAIATFKEKKFEEFRQLVDKEEQKEMDEQSVLRFKTEERKQGA